MHARPNRIDTASSVSFRLMDRAARSPFHCGMARRGPRARRRLEVAVRRSAQQSYGCAYSDVRWGSTSTTFNMIIVITFYINHRGCRNVYCVWGVVCLFGSVAMGPNTRRRAAQKTSSAEAQTSSSVVTITTGEGVWKSNWAASWHCQSRVICPNGQDNQSNQ